MTQVHQVFPGRPPEIDLAAHTLFLDLDGTIAAFEIDPSAVGPDPRRDAILRRLDDGLDGRLAIVSGRRIADVDRILNGRVRGVAGLHGLERRTATRRQFTAKPHGAVNRAREAFVALASHHRGVTVEMKGLSVALHYRARPELTEALAPSVAMIQNETNLVLQAGHCVFELRTPGADKGDAVRAFMAEPPFLNARPVYIGDDLTDERAFRAVQALGGFGVLVGEPRVTAALYRLDGVAEVIDWLDALTPSRSKPSPAPVAAHV